MVYRKHREIFLLAAAISNPKYATAKPYPFFLLFILCVCRSSHFQQMLGNFVIFVCFLTNLLGSIPMKIALEYNYILQAIASAI